MGTVATAGPIGERALGRGDTGTTHLGDALLKHDHRPPRLVRRALDATLGMTLFAAAVTINATVPPTDPAEQLYYVPIIFAAIRLGRVAALMTVVGAALGYHFAEVGVRGTPYQQTDVVQLVVFAAVALATLRITRDARRLRKLASTDDLTGLLNLRAFENAALAAIDAAKRDRACVAVLSLDLDRLKALNDSYGHLTGADAVKTVGRIIGERLPPGASACRFGGDEFFIVIPRCEAGCGVRVAADIDAAVAAAPSVLDEREFPPGTLSVSVGSACRGVPLGADPDRVFHELLRDADVAMYEVKRRRHES